MLREENDRLVSELAAAKQAGYALPPPRHAAGELKGVNGMNKAIWAFGGAYLYNHKYDIPLNLDRIVHVNIKEAARPRVGTLQQHATPINAHWKSI